MLYKVLMSLSHARKAQIIMAVDLTVVTVALFAVQAISHTKYGVITALWHLPILLLAAGSTIHILRLNRSKLNAYGLDDIAGTFVVAAALVISGAATGVLLGAGSLSVVSLLQTAGVFMILSIASRILMLRVVRKIYAARSNRRRVLIYGAGQTGQQLAAALQTDDEFEAACFADDDPNLQRLSILGLRVHSPNQIPMLVRRNGIDRVVLAMPSADQAIRLRLAKRLSGLGCEVLALPSFADIVLRGEESTAAAPVAVNSLLGRDAVEHDLPETESSYRGRRILVTGAGGSIGRELCRQLAGCQPAHLVLLDHSEYALYQVAQNLKDHHPNTHFTCVLGSVEHAALVADVLTTHEIDVVFHAAAYKHVGLVQENAFEGVRNNVFGTRVVAEEARRAGVERFILVSTDKAVRPTSMMGCSKRLAELLVQDLATRSEVTKYSMVRFGNVLGSSGSVIPLFQQQIRQMGPVTVTHRDVTRYFMTVDEAVRLVLLAGTFSRGGDLFVLDMGQPASIYAMARKMIEAAGHTVRDEMNPSGDIAIVFTGLKPGEKMHEELLIGSDMLTTPHPKILRAQENHISELAVAAALQDLRRAIEQRDEELLHATMQRCVAGDASTKPADQTRVPTLTVVGES